ncbi:MAG: exosortase/archaeosortase family protein [Roseibacillus sp.]
MSAFWGKSHLLVISVVFLVMFTLLGYSSGYGTVVDGGVVFLRSSLLSHMKADYSRDGGEWSFGYFVPFAVGALFWFRRKELLGTEVKPALVVGGAICVMAFLLYWAGYRGEQKYFGYAAGQLLALGAIFWFLGWGWFRKLFWLWVLLGMMWPWRFLIGRISAPLQMAMVKLTSGFMNLIGVDAVASGSSLSTASTDPVTSLPISLDVDVACSGMRSLFALTMIGLVFAFLRVKDEWKRWALMAFVPVVAILGNFVRMLMLYFGSVLWGTDFAIGENHEMSAFHMLAGLMVFVVALILMSGLVGIFEGGWKKFFTRRKVTIKKVS